MINAYMLVFIYHNGGEHTATTLWANKEKAAIKANEMNQYYSDNNDILDNRGVWVVRDAWVVS